MACVCRVITVCVSGRELFLSMACAHRFRKVALSIHFRMFSLNTELNAPEGGKFLRVWVPNYVPRT